MVILIAVMVAMTNLVDSAVGVAQGSRLKQLANDVVTSKLDATIQGGGSSLLSDMGETSLGTTTVGGVTLSLERDVEPGDGSCAAPSGGEPVELGVTIYATWIPSATGSWWTDNNSRMVEESSVVAVPATALSANEGELLVKVTDEGGNGQGGVQVTLNPSADTAETSSLGCVLFTNLAPGAYTATLSESGWIDSDDDVTIGGSPATVTPKSLAWTQTVTGGSTADLPPTGEAPPAPYYAQEATVSATYSVSSLNGLTPATPSNVLSLPLAFYTTTETDGSGLPTPPVNELNPAEVFPFTGTPSYTVVAGSCGASTAPDGYATDGVPVPSATTSLTPGGSDTVGISLTPVDVVVVNSGGTGVNNATVTATETMTSGATDPNCPVSGATMPTLSFPSTSSVAADIVKLPGAHPDVLADAVHHVAARSPVVGQEEFPPQFPVVAGSVTSGQARYYLTVAQGTSTSNPTSSVNPSQAGQPVTFTSTVSPSGSGTPQGTLEFYQNGTTQIGCVGVGSDPTKPATCTVSNFSAGSASDTGSTTLASMATGSYAISAKFVAQSTSVWANSTSPGSLTQTVNAQTPTIVLSSSANPSQLGGAFTITATVTPSIGGSPAPTGTVTFYDNGNPTPIGTGTLTASGSNGEATYTSAAVAVGTYTPTALGPGTNSITASYGGDTNYSSASTAAALSQQVACSTTYCSVSGLPYGNYRLYASSGAANSSYSGAPVIVLQVNSSGVFEWVNGVNKGQVTNGSPIVLEVK